MKTMNENLQNFLNKMWTDYCLLNPQAQLIYRAFKSKNQDVINDHIALRTFNHPKLGLKSLAKPFEKYGYESRGEYFFKEKKLYAQHFENKFDENLPKIFISELELEKMPNHVQTVLNQCIDQIDSNSIQSENFIYSGTHWSKNFKTYEDLATVSEYASWVYAFGFRPNHFTVSVNHLTLFSELTEINTFIKSLGVQLNTSGGEIKGTPTELLEQSSTKANSIKVQFSDGEFEIPACYYEFAKRYKLSSGKFYQGFIAQSADKIFESTNRN